MMFCHKRKRVGPASVAIIALAMASQTAAAQDPQDNYAFPNPKQERANMFGDWGGMRPWLAARGITFRISNTTDTLGIVHGGLSNQPTSFTRIRGTLDVDLEQLTGAKGLSAHATGLWQTGVNVGDKLGSFANPSGIGSVHVFRMDSYWLQQTLKDGVITLRAGQMAGWDFFGNHEFGEAFVIEPLNYAFGNIFANTYLTYNPAGVPGALIRVDAFRNHPDSPLTGLYVKSGIFSGNQDPYAQDPTGMHFRFKNSPAIASEVGYVFERTESRDTPLPPGKKLYPGIYRFGGVVNPNGSFVNPTTGLPSKGNYLWYIEAAQAVYRAEAGSIRGLDVTFGYDWSPNDVTQQNAMLTAGARYHGIIPSRVMDEVDVGFVSTRASNTLSQVNESMIGLPLGWEKAYTINYRAQIKPWLVVQPVAQYFQSIAGNPARASGVVVGLRTYFRL
jgi:porin